MKFTARKIVSATMFIIFAILTISFYNSLSRYHNVISVSVLGNEELIKLKRMISTDVLYYSVVERYSDIALRRGGFFSDSVSIYKCENSLNDVAKLSISHGNFDVTDNSIVISTALANRYFSYSDCVGQKISIDDIEYVVAGVYKPSVINFFTAREEYAAYASNVSATKADSAYEVVIMCADKYAPIIRNRIGVMNTGKAINMDAIATFRIEPQFIPSDLSDLSEVITKLKMLFIAANNQTFVDGVFYAEIRTRAYAVMICFALALIIFFVELRFVVTPD